MPSGIVGRLIGIVCFVFGGMILMFDQALVGLGSVAYSDTSVLVASAVALIFIALGIMWIVEYTPRK